ncbi:MAG: hypothetical protein ACSHX0_03115 [Akkermansiaceae bacterium]
MTAHELYQAIKPSVISDMFMWMRDTDRELYKNALSSLAASRKMRLPYMQKKSIAEQIEWMHKTLKLKSCDMMGEHILQVYFMQGQEAMLVTFCDSLEIPHDGKGQVEGELPEKLEADQLEKAVTALLEKNEPALVSLYLHTFNLQTPDGWEVLTAKLASDERLKLA